MNFNKHTAEKIENILHPCLWVNGFAILHRHSAKNITFFAMWENTTLPRTFDATKEQIAEHTTRDGLINAFHQDFLWLTEK